MARLDNFAARKKLTAAIVVLLASAPIIAVTLRLFCYFTRRDLMDGSPALYEVEMFLIQLTLFLLVFALINKRVTGTTLAIALWFAALLSQCDNLLALYHGASLSEHAASHPLSNTMTLFVNPTPLLYCTVALTALVLMMAIKRFRSLDRVYIISIGAFVLSTTAIFHSTLQGGLQEILASTPRLISSGAEKSPVCAQRSYDCISIPAMNHNGKSATFAARTMSAGNVTIANRISYTTTHEVGFVQLVDLKMVPTMIERFRTMFAMLSIPVHAAWIIASLIGLALHKRALVRRQREQRNIDDYVEKRFYEFIQG